MFEHRGMLNRTKTHLALLISLIATALLSTALLAGAAQAAPKVWNLPGATVSSSDGPASTPAFTTGADGTIYAVWTRRYGSRPALREPRLYCSASWCWRRRM